MKEFLEDAEGAAERGEIGPGKANRERDRQTFPKRFYESVTIEQTDQLFEIRLDGKPVKTPGRVTVALPTLRAAELVKTEWEAVAEEINPLHMPTTRLANTAVDGVAQEMQAVMEDITRYAGSDLLCYRADAPEGLVERQRFLWDPILDWAETTLGQPFELVEGIMHTAQPKATIAAFSQLLGQHQEAFKLTALHTLTSISGSAIIALALAQGHLTAEQAWEAANVDEDWNISLWGEDYEAAERRKHKRIDFEAAHRLFVAVA